MVLYKRVFFFFRKLVMNKNTWFKMVLLIIGIQRKIDDYQKLIKKNPFFPKFRNFAIVSIHRYKRKHILIDYAVFYGILKELGIGETP